MKILPTPCACPTPEQIRIAIPYPEFELLIGKIILILTDYHNRDCGRAEVIGIENKMDWVVSCELDNLTCKGKLDGLHKSEKVKKSIVFF